MSMRLLRAVARAAVAASFVVALGGCAERSGPTESRVAARVSKDQATPSPIVTVTDGGNSVEFWPYTGDDFSGVTGDPINLVFFGNADPRALRAALMMLDGDRTAVGLPDADPFNCRWHDVPEGNVQTAFGSATGWVGGVIQLACGDFPVRFHLRLFDLGGGTVGGAHFEVQIPGTTDHQVLSWEFAEQIVVFDFSRTGLLGALPVGSGVINATPFYRDIPAAVFNGLLGDPSGSQLLGLLGYPSTTQANPVPLPSDGKATVLTLAGSEDGQPLVAQQRFVIDFDQVIPKPFCQATPFDALFVEGPVTLTQHVVLTPSGNYLSTFQANGQLTLTPWDVSTNSPTGDPVYRAKVNEQHHAILTDNVSLAASFQMLIEIPSAGPLRGRLVTRVSVGPGNASLSAVTLRCGN